MQELLVEFLREVNIFFTLVVNIIIISTADFTEEGL